MIDKKSFTVCYIATLAVFIFLNLICPFLKIYWYFAFSIKQIKENYQYWRFITTYLIKPTRKVNFGTFMTLVSVYIDLHNLEISAKSKNKYSKFIMIILIQCILNTLLTYLAYYTFNLKESRSLLNELSYAFSAINSYKNPNGKTFISYVPVRNKFVPIALLIVRIYVNKDISLYILKTPLIGFISGFLFCILTKKFKIKYIPPFLKKILNEPTDEQRKTLKENLIQYQKEVTKLQKKLKKLKKEKNKLNNNINNNINNNMGPNPFINILETQNNNFNIYNQQPDQNEGFHNNHNLDHNYFRYQNYMGANNINNDNDNDNEEIDYNVDNEQEQEQDNNEEYNNNEGDGYEDKKDNEQIEGGDEDEKNKINENENNMDDNYENLPDEVKKENEDKIEEEKNMEEKEENKNDENENNAHEKND